MNLDQSGCSSSNSGDDSRLRAASPWNSSFSEQSEGEDATAELTVTNLPPFEPAVLQVGSVTRSLHMLQVGDLIS